MSRLLPVFLLTALTPLCACKKGPPELADVMKKYKAPVEAKIAAIDATITQPLPAGTQPLKIDGPVQMHNRYGDATKPVAGNATLLRSSAVGYLDRDAYASVKIPGADVLNDCAALVKRSEMADGRKATGFWAERPMQVCAQLRYVFVVDEKQVNAPSVNEAAKTYTPGTYKAVVHGYDLDEKKYVGSVTVDAKTADKVENFRGAGYGSDAVAGKFMSAAATGIDNAIGKAVPSFKRD